MAVNKIVVLNVGASTKDLGIRGPIFEDGRFAFVPIPETQGELGTTYRDLGLSKYVPETCANLVAHNDPEFETFTYGHAMRVGDVKPLRALQPGDFLFFMATLDFRGPEQTRTKWINPNWGAYLIGFFRIQHIIEGTEFENARPEIKQLFARNAHLEDGHFDVDWAIKGDLNSAKLKIAVPLSDPAEGKLPNQLTKSVFLAEWLEANPGKEPKGWYRWVLKCYDRDKIAKLWHEIDQLNPGQSRRAKVA
jgi:hypothetical protein